MDDQKGNQDGRPLKLDNNISDLPMVLNHVQADNSSCEASLEDSPNPSSKVLELIRHWREKSWSLQPGRCVHLRKCEHLPRWFISAGECCPLNTPAPAAREFCTAIERAKNLVEECSHDMWLLKAVELWECTEHFVEVLLDLCWSAYIVSLGIGSIERSQKWIRDLDELLNSRSEQNDVARLFHEDYDENDKKDLDIMVQAKLIEQNLEMDSPEHQLAHLLQDRLNNQSLWRPPFLRRHKFHIYSYFIVPLRRSSKGGTHGTILKLKWVYGKEFAMKMRHPKEDGVKTFKWEFDILDKYRSPYIVGVIGYWEAESWSSWNPLARSVRCPFLLMENLEFDLKELMNRCKSTSLERTRDGFSELDTICLLLPIAKALRFLHGKDIAHRDVKPQNIMCKNVNLPEDPEDTVVKEDTIVKLIDFGEARENVSDPRECGKWGRAGTPGYMDPTMWKQDVVGYTLFMSDVFSFAMVFTELLTWRSPSEAFHVSRPQDAQAKLKADERPFLPSDLPDYLRFIVESCWHVDCLKRPEFKDICSMLQHAKILLLNKDFAYEPEELFSYEDATGGYCRFSRNISYL